MSDLINHLSRFAGFILAGLGGPAFWTISSSGHVIGSLTFEAGTSERYHWANASAA